MSPGYCAQDYILGIKLNSLSNNHPNIDINECWSTNDTVKLIENCSWGAKIWKKERRICWAIKKVGWNEHEISWKRVKQYDAFEKYSKK